jgi:hypothetical protein
VLLAEAQKLARLSIGPRGFESLEFAGHRHPQSVFGQNDVVGSFTMISSFVALNT